MDLVSSDFFVLRTPIFPYKLLDKLKLNDIRQDSRFLDALYSASSKLPLEELNNGKLDEKKKRRLIITIGKYLLRAHTRSTPFGLFATISLGHIGDSTSLKLQGINSVQTKTRLDSEFITYLSEDLLKEPTVRQQIRYWLNSSVVKVSSVYQYIEYRIENGIKRFFLSEIEAIEALDYIVTILNQQPGFHYRDLLKKICKQLNTSTQEEEASEFIDSLIASKFLLSELELFPFPVQGQDKAEQLVQILKTENNRWSPILENLLEVANRADQNRIGDKRKFYFEINKQIEKAELLTVKTINDFYQVDSFRPLKGHLTSKIAQELKDTIEFLSYLPRPVNKQFEKFKEVFANLYEEAEVPLLQVLNTETGLGYPINSHQIESSFIEGLFETDNDRRTDWHSWNNHLLNLYTKAIQKGQLEINLTNKDIESIEKQKNIAASLFSVITILASTQEDIDSGNYQLLHHLTTGPSSSRWLGRFCHLDENLTILLREALEKEQEFYPDCVLAEIAHISQPRSGNVIYRPPLRPYYIPLLSPSLECDSEPITLDDIYISCIANELILRSKRLNKRILPRLSSAHDAQKYSLPLYKLLVDIQDQEMGTLSFTWGPMAKDQPFLPRVTFGKTILSPSIWQLTNDQQIHLSTLEENSFIEEFTKISWELNLPEIVLIGEGDNRLPISIASIAKDAVTRAILMQWIQTTKDRILLEDLSINSKWVSSPEGKHSHEIIIPFYNRAPEPKRLLKLDMNAVISQKRRFGFGSEWIYFKIYAGIQATEKILLNVLPKWIQSIEQRGLIQKWFFVRYQDDKGHHLRIRFFGTDNFYLTVSQELHTLLNPFLESNQIQNIVIDTYQREIERYGAELIEVTETLFYYDSRTVMNLLGNIDEDSKENSRILIAFLLVDSFMSAFGLSLLEKYQMMNWQQSTLKKIFKIHKSTQLKKLSDKYQKSKSLLFFLEKPINSESNDISQIRKIIDIHWSKCINVITILSKDNDQAAPIKSRLAAYLHMSLNRLFTTNSNHHELVIYYCLCKHYESKIKQIKN
ncbi:lantibiotic dehydratase [Xanthocytophaga agilis]|uniref:Lantibiotic dehydratase n=1 Tax=Xanthocytophaga agilis TaxID=3048010 RepID=A0AAE3RBR6_9BACT|nr:lantibiotic dehydratase [Xanthocytophaga agilis]MDJ1505219.1 lantibiotic dehydratase [Xanthocytophaga agilis]